MTAVAWIGLGAMGARMARRLVEAGHEVHVWNRTAERAHPLAEIGAVAAETPGAAAARAEVAVTMLADPPAVEAVVSGPGGLAGALPPGADVIEMSTIGPAALQRLRARLPREAGLLDAPVLGSIAEAEAGRLRLFVGGPTPLVDRWTPLLSALGTPLHVGELGKGAAAKLVANASLLGVLGVLGETLALASALGLERDRAFEVLAATPLAEQAQRRRGAIESGDYPPRFRLALARKDAQLIEQAAAEAGVELRLARAVLEWLAQAERHGHADRDYTAVLGEIASARPVEPH